MLPSRLLSGGNPRFAAAAANSAADAAGVKLGDATGVMLGASSPLAAAGLGGAGTAIGAARAAAGAEGCRADAGAADDGPA